MKTLVREVDVSNGYLIDEMLENGSLTVHEKSEIDGLSKLDKTRKLATIIGRKDKSKFKTFVETISGREFYPHIGKLLNESYHSMLAEKKTRIECIRCFIVQKVNTKQIMDHLCEKRFIDLNEVDTIIEGEQNNINLFWEKSFQKIFDPVWGETYVSVFKAALQEDYPHIARKIHSSQNLKCLCPTASLSDTGSDGNASEISTTSDIFRDTKPETLEWVNKHANIHMQYPTNSFMEVDSLGSSTRSITCQSRFEKDLINLLKMKSLFLKNMNACNTAMENGYRKVNSNPKF